MVSACERSTVFDPVLACVTMALLCVTMVLTCEIPHTQHPVDPGRTPTAHISDLPPKYVTDDGLEEAPSVLIPDAHAVKTHLNTVMAALHQARLTHTLS